MNEPSALDPLTIIEEEARAVAKCFGVAASNEVAAAMVDRVRFRLAGVRFYVRSSAGRDRARQIREEIKSKFNGRNIAELSSEYGMSERHLRRILFKQRASKK